MQNIPHRIIALSALLFFASTDRGIGGDALHFMMNGTEDTLALGTVISVEGKALKFQNKQRIRGPALPSLLTVQLGNMTTQKLNLQQGDAVVVSVIQQGNQYTTSWGIWPVSSLDLRTLDLKPKSLAPYEQAMFQWYLNSGGRDKQFSYGNGEVTVKHCDDTITKIPVVDQKRPAPRPTPPSMQSHLLCWQNWVIQESSGSPKWMVGGAIFTLFFLILFSIAKQKQPHPS